MAASPVNLPNLITLGRILACPVLFVLVLSPETTHLLTAFILFVFASVSDLWDGFLARKYDLVSDTGKILDPLADKLLLASTLIPFYLVSQGPDLLGRIPMWGALPLWVLIVFFGREVAVTLLRAWAARRGHVISAGMSGKIKAFVQNLFSGSLILWYFLVRTAEVQGWSGTLWEGWAAFHRSFVVTSLAVALFLTVYSMGVYLWQYRHLLDDGVRS